MLCAMRKAAMLPRALLEAGEWLYLQPCQRAVPPPTAQDGRSVPLLLPGPIKFEDPDASSRLGVFFIGFIHFL